MNEINVNEFYGFYVEMPKKGRYELLKYMVYSLNKGEVNVLLNQLDERLLESDDKLSKSGRESKLNTSSMLDFFKSLNGAERMILLVKIIKNTSYCDSEDLVEIIDTRIDELNALDVELIESSTDDDEEEEESEGSDELVFVSPSLTESEDYSKLLESDNNRLNNTEIYPTHFLQSSFFVEEEENKFCNLCDKSIKKKGWYKHMNTVHSTQKYSCSLCPNSKFKAKKYWKAHMRNIHKDLNIQFPDGRQAAGIRDGNSDLQCGECGTAFGSVELLKIHLENVHRTPEGHFLPSVSSDNEDEDYELCEIGSTVKLLSCSNCQQSFTNAAELDEHLKQVHDCNYAQCPHCLVMTKSLRNHIKFVHMKKFQCELCQKSFSANAKLTRHLESHLRGTNRLHNPSAQTYQTDLPLKSYSHILPKDKPKNITCDLCGYKCVSTWKLNRHMRAHMKGTNRFSLE